jgi:hypothetical protein
VCRLRCPRRIGVMADDPRTRHWWGCRRAGGRGVKEEESQLPVYNCEEQIVGFEQLGVVESVEGGGKQGFIGACVAKTC